MLVAVSDKVDPIGGQKRRTYLLEIGHLDYRGEVRDGEAQVVHQVQLVFRLPVLSDLYDRRGVLSLHGLHDAEYDREDATDEPLQRLRSPHAQQRRHRVYLHLEVLAALRRVDQSRDQAAVPARQLAEVVVLDHLARGVGRVPPNLHHRALPQVPLDDLGPLDGELEEGDADAVVLEVGAVADPEEAADRAQAVHPDVHVVVAEPVGGVLGRLRQYLDYLALWVIRVEHVEVLGVEEEEGVAEVGQGPGHVDCNVLGASLLHRGADLVGAVEEEVWVRESKVEGDDHAEAAKRRLSDVDLAPRITVAE